MESAKTRNVQYNRARDPADQLIAQYFTRLSRLIRDRHPQRTVLDVCVNGGGNDYLNAPVEAWVKASLPAVDGRSCVIIGRGTYSAAQRFVTRLEAATDVTFVGEPTGGSPNHFGDAVTLPR